MLRLAKLLSVLSLLNHNGHTTLTRHEHNINAWASTLSNKTFSAQSQSGHNSPRGMVDNSSQLPVPLNISRDGYDAQYLANYQHIKSGFCAIYDNFCSFKASNGTIIEATATNLSDQCLLWDDSCSGNKTAAIEKFFDTAIRDQHAAAPSICRSIMCNSCFQQRFVNQSDCHTYNYPERLSELQQIKDWMRSPRCVSAADEWIAKTGYSWGYYFGTMNESKAELIKELGNSSGVIPSCCGSCLIYAANVDLFYWPEPDSDTSCLSVIGDIRPFDYGAMTEGGTTYWGCTVSTITLTTAQITTIGSLAVKVSSYSPWSSPLCVEDKAGSQSLNQSSPSASASIRRRAHSLIVPTPTTHVGGLPISTVVSGGFTFTSPSIYANFHGLSIDDMCGNSVVWSTMLSFSAGELSTIEGPLGIPGLREVKSKRFEFRDLPCPPQSIMEANWYKPQPGEPYRPLIAMPSKIKEVFSWAPFCDEGFFTAYDPPSALISVTALAPPVAPSDPKAPVSSTTLDTPAGSTIGTKASTPVPASIPKVEQPKATINATPAGTNKEAPSTRSQANDPATQESLPSQASMVQPNGDPKGGDSPQQISDPKQDNDPTKVSNPNHGSDLKPQQNNDPTQGIHPSKPSDPNHGSDPKLQQNSDTEHGSGSSKASDLSHGTDPAQGSDPNRGNGPQQGNDNSEKSGRQADPKPSNGRDPLDKSKGSSQHAVPVPQREPTQTVVASPLNDFADDQAGTINKPMVELPSDSIFIAGTTLDRGVPSNILSGTKTIALQNGDMALGGLITGDLDGGAHSGIPNRVTTTINGQAIIADSTASSIADTILTPGAPGLALSGTTVSLNTAAHSVIKTKEMSSESKNPGSSGETAGVGGLTKGAFVSGGPFDTDSPASVQGNVSMRGNNGTGTRPQVFNGGTASVRCLSLWTEMITAVLAMSVLEFL